MGQEVGVARERASARHAAQRLPPCVPETRAVRTRGSLAGCLATEANTRS